MRDSVASAYRIDNQQRNHLIKDWWDIQRTGRDKKRKRGRSPFRLPAESRGFNRLIFGAGNEARTRDLNLGKVALYQLSYSRITRTD